MKLSKEFYLHDDVVFLSKELLGKYLYTDIDGHLTGGIIVETEAYKAPEDKASHAYGNKKTPRTIPFYKEGGIAYVYLCYGIHYLFNIVTNKLDMPNAILIRAIEPTDGIEVMLERRKKLLLTQELTAGPGAMSMALGINKTHNEVDLCSNTIWLEDKGITIPCESIVASPRVGVGYAEEWALVPWRFRINGNKYTSKAK